MSFQRGGATPKTPVFTAFREINPSRTVEKEFEQYWRHASALRQWFVVYGIAGGAIVLTNTPAFEGLSPCAKRWVMILFLLGVASQVVLALINKIIHWAIYRGDDEQKLQGRWWYKKCYRISNCFLVDMIMDVFRMIAFAVAVVLLVGSL